MGFLRNQINKNKNNMQIQLILIINSIEVKLKGEFKGDILAHMSQQVGSIKPEKER